MNTLYLERSAGNGRGGDWVEGIDLEGVERIVVGIGPGSFAGVRSAIAFAQGYALGRRCEVLGLPSPCAAAAQVFAERGECRLAVVGDARCGKVWAALFNGLSMVRDVFQTDADRLGGEVPDGFLVATVDAARIGERLALAFGDRFVGGVTPTADGLRAFAEANESLLIPEPLPIYLNPAVRGAPATRS